MRFLLTFFLFYLCIDSMYAQSDSLKTMSIEIDIVVHDDQKIKADLKSFFTTNKIVPDIFNEFDNNFTTNFTLSESQYSVCIAMLESHGAVVSRKVESINYSEKLRLINLEIERLEKEKDEYAKLLIDIDVKSDNHIKYWEKLEEIKSNLRKQIKLKEEYEGSNKKFKVKLKVTENNILTTEPDFSFVNMPGIQYSYFIPANTSSGPYPESMNGYAIKYLMNRRKTYLELGLFKSTQVSAPLFYDELYKFGIGQDFYSSHLGRGTRKFANLYSGFSFGTFIFSGGGNNNIISWYATPSIGLEIFKNKYFLLDTKTSYFLPFKENRNVRGFLFEASFNIVF